MIKITADSTCDLTPEIIEALAIEIIPVHIVIDDEIYEDNINIHAQDIFTKVEIEHRSCKTAAVNEQEYEVFFQRLSGQYEAVIHLSLGAKFSSCWQNASQAAKHYPNIHVIDTQNLSSASGYLVYKAAQLAQAGQPLPVILAEIKSYVPTMDASFVIDKLDYLYKGGRCTGVEMVSTKFLRIKPCIEVKEGEMKVGKKYRGSLDLSLRNYLKDRLSSPQIDRSLIFITHAACQPETVRLVKEQIMRDFPFEQVIITTAGCTISAHCGPNTLGVLFRHQNAATPSSDI